MGNNNHKQHQIATYNNNTDNNTYNYNPEKNTFLCCKNSKWELINLSEIDKIKSITGTALDTVILTESNELFFFSEDLRSTNYFNNFKDNQRLYQFDFTNFVKNELKLNFIPTIKEIFGCYNFVILQLENDECLLFAGVDSNVQGIYIKDNFKMFTNCTLSSRVLAVTKNNKFKSWQFGYDNTISEKQIHGQANNIINGLLKKGIKILTCGGGFSVIVTKDNKMYVEGPNTYNSQSGIQTEEFEYTYLKTSFEEMSEIEQVKCGYFHTIVLLNNGKVFATGYNILNQCGKKNLNDIPIFTEFKLPIVLLIKEIGCTSRGTYFTTINTDKVYFIGEVVETLKQEEFGEVTAHCLSLQYSPSLYFNTIVPGGWHYIVYYKNINQTKSLIYFKHNLQKLLNKNYFNDINFKFNN